MLLADRLLIILPLIVVWVEYFAAPKYIILEYARDTVLPRSKTTAFLSLLISSEFLLATTHHFPAYYGLQYI